MASPLCKSKKATDFRAHFNIGWIYERQLLKSIVTLDNVPANKFADAIRTEASARSKPVKLNIFASFLHPNLQEIGTEKFRQLRRASFAIATNAAEDPRMHKFYYILFRFKQSIKAKINEFCFFELFLTLDGVALLLR